VSITREVRVDIGGKNYTIASDDNYLEHIKNGFEPDMVKLFRAVTSSSDVILDIGANIGCTALLFGELSKKVYAFEPSPTTFAFLEKNISRSGLKNVSPQNMGLGAESGEYTLTFAPSNRSGGFVSNQTQASAGHTVETIVIRQMDEVLQSLNISRVDFIKIDVEGFEGHVLRGATQTLATYRPVVVLELNHWCLNAFQRISIPDFFDLLRSIFPILLAVDGLSYLNLHDESDTYVVMYNHILHMKFPNIIAAFDESRLSKFRSLYQHQSTAYIVKEIDFKDPNYPEFIADVLGMSGCEPIGRWTDGRTARFCFKQQLPNKLTLEITADAFGPNIGKSIVVRIGNVEKKFVVEMAGANKTYSLKFEGVNSADTIEFIPPKPTSPKDIDSKNMDSRKLGVLLISLKIRDMDVA
jgi:FkbM family methyltransferase